MIKAEGTHKKGESPLPELAGIDIADGMARVGDNQGFDRKILRKFRTGNFGVMEKIRRELARDLNMNLGE